MAKVIVPQHLQGNPLTVHVVYLPHYQEAWGRIGYETDGSAGFDLRAAIKDVEYLHPRDRKLIPTGLRLAVPYGYELQVRPRSGLALKQGITVLNTPGTVDCDYRGEIGVILFNAGADTVTIKPGDRIAQGVFAAYQRFKFRKSDVLDETERGDGGFGSTGTSVGDAKG